MSDLIPRDAAIGAIERWWMCSQTTWQSPMTILRAIPAIDPAAIEATAEARGRRTGIATEKLDRLVNWLKEDEDNVFLLPAGDIEKMRAILAAIPQKDAPND